MIKAKLFFQKRVMVKFLPLEGSSNLMEHERNFRVEESALEIPK